MPLSRALLLAALLFGGPTAVSAQAAPAPEGGWGLWFTTGLGVGLVSDSYDALGVTAQLSAQVGPHLVAVAGHYVESFSSGPSIDAGSFLYGRAKTGRWGRLSVASGISRVTACNTSRDGRPCTVTGLPIVAEATLRGEIVGLGLHAFANLNSRETFGGVLLVLQLGRMR